MSRRGPRRTLLGGWRIAVCCALSFPISTASPTLAAEKEKKEESDEVDYVALAARLIGDGHYDRAERMLSEVDPEAEGVNKKQLYTLQGVLFLKKQLFSASADSFEKAIAEGQDQPAVRFYLAQGYYGAKKFDKCLVALAAAGKEGQVEAGYLMKAQAHWELKHPAEAVSALGEGLAKFPGHAELGRMKIFLLVELGLYQEVVELSRGYLARAEVSPDDYVAVGQALRSGGQHRQAQLLLEKAHLRFPASEAISVQLAHAYLDGSSPSAAAMIFEDVARVNPKYHLEAAELYKKARRLDRALRLNGRVHDQKEKLSQRLSLLLEQERFEQIAAMQPVLSRLNLLSDEDIRYALAFAYFNTRQFERAERTMKGITKTRLFEATLELRKAIDSCRQAGWECTQ